MEQQNLKHCPFCESKNDMYVADRGPDEHRYCQVICKNCGTWGPVSYTHEEAASKWNCRALTNDPPKGNLLPCPWCGSADYLLDHPSIKCDNVGKCSDKHQWAKGPDRRAGYLWNSQKL